MEFGEVSIDQALGARLAHSVRVADGRLAKGAPVDAATRLRLHEAGLRRVTVFRLEADDVAEDAAAGRIAHALCGDVPGDVRPEIKAVGTGRVNLHARADGLARIDRACIDRLNALDEGLTVATLEPRTPVIAGRMLATVKIIPYALPATLIETARALLATSEPPIGLAPWRPHAAALVQTRLRGTKESMLDKTRDVTLARLARRRATLVAETRTEHAVEPLAHALSASLEAAPDWLLVIGASAISDRRDVVPRAIVALGGRVERLGIPMDPGNLLLLGRIGDTRVIGLPGCARSPVDNGCDRLLDRLAVGDEVEAGWLATLGVGGLLGEIVDRPRPRAASAGRSPATGESSRRVSALVLAAGGSSRFGAENKLLHPWRGRPFLAHVLDAVTASTRLSGEAPAHVLVTGHAREAIERVLRTSGGDAAFVPVHNPAFADGMAGSLARGLSALIERDAVIVCLGDMPEVTPAVIDALVDGFERHPRAAIVVPVHAGRRGNPVLIARRLFDSVLALEGDVGARVLARRFPDSVLEVETECAAVLRDYDVPADLERLPD